MEKDFTPGSKNRNRCKKCNFCSRSRPWNDYNRRRTRFILQIRKHSKIPCKTDCNVQGQQIKNSTHHGKCNSKRRSVASYELRKTFKTYAFKKTCRRRKTFNQVHKFKSVCNARLYFRRIKKRNRNHIKRKKTGNFIFK